MSRLQLIANRFKNLRQVNLGQEDTSTTIGTGQETARILGRLVGKTLRRVHDAFEEQIQKTKEPEKATNQYDEILKQLKLDKTYLRVQISIETIPDSTSITSIAEIVTRYCLEKQISDDVLYNVILNNGITKILANRVLEQNNNKITKTVANENLVPTFTDQNRDRYITALLAYSAKANTNNHLTVAFCNFFGTNNNQQDLKAFFDKIIIPETLPEAIRNKLDNLDVTSEPLTLNNLTKAAFKKRIQLEVAAIRKSPEYIQEQTNFLVNSILNQAKDQHQNTEHQIDPEQLKTALNESKKQHGENLSLILPTLLAALDPTTLASTIKHRVLNTIYTILDTPATSLFNPQKEHIAPSAIDAASILEEFEKHAVILKSETTYHNWLRTFSTLKDTPIETIKAEYETCFTAAQNLIAECEDFAFGKNAHLPANRIPEIAKIRSFKELFEAGQPESVQKLAEKYNHSEEFVLLCLTRLMHLVIKNRQISKTPKIVYREENAKEVEKYLKKFVTLDEDPKWYLNIDDPKNPTYTKEPASNLSLPVLKATIKLPTSLEDALNNSIDEYKATTIYVYSGKHKDIPATDLRIINVKTDDSIFKKCLKYRVSEPEKGTSFYDIFRSSFIAQSDEDLETIMNGVNFITKQAYGSLIKSSVTTVNKDSGKGFKMCYVKGQTNVQRPHAAADNKRSHAVDFEIQIGLPEDFAKANHPEDPAYHGNLKLKQLKSLAKDILPFSFYSDLYQLRADEFGMPNFTLTPQTDALH